MKTIGLKDLKLKVVEVVAEVKQKPLFLGMQEKDIFRIEYSDDCIYGYNKDGLEIYLEDSNKYWRKREYKDGLEIYLENSNKYWSKREYKDGLEIYFENSNKYWRKIEDGKIIEYRNGKYTIDRKEAELLTI